MIIHNEDGTRDIMLTKAGKIEDCDDYVGNYTNVLEVYFSIIINKSDLYKAVDKFERIYGKVDWIDFDNKYQDMVISNESGIMQIPCKNIPCMFELDPYTLDDFKNRNDKYLSLVLDSITAPYWIISSHDEVYSDDILIEIEI